MADSISHNDTSSRNWFGKLVNGDFGLPKTYWLYGVLAALVANIILRLVSSYALLYWAIFATYVVYIVAVFGGIWRAADQYQGPAILAGLAKVAVFLGVLHLVFSFFPKV